MHAWVVDVRDRVAQRLAFDHTLESDRRFKVVVASSAAEAIDKAIDKAKDAMP